MNATETLGAPRTLCPGASVLLCGLREALPPGMGWDRASLQPYLRLKLLPVASANCRVREPPTPSLQLCNVGSRGLFYSLGFPSSLLPELFLLPCSSLLQALLPPPYLCYGATAVPVEVCSIPNCCFLWM